MLFAAGPDVWERNRTALESFISSYNAFRVFWWLQGSMFFLCCVPHLAFVNGFQLLATAKVTKETNFFTE